jgi:SynChlorMet cassette radical SAM/SPASM protein ScmF
MTCEIEKSVLEGSEKAGADSDLPEGIPPLRALYLYISGSCNLACRHCWITPDFESEERGGVHVTFEYVQKAVSEAQPLGLTTVKLTGGEPLMHPRFREIFTLLNEEGLRWVLETNGTLIDRDMAAFLGRSNRAGFVSVSVDGVDAETHEFMRCVTGSFKRAISGIRNLVEQGLRPQLICTLHRKNASQMEGMIGLAQDLGCGSVKFNHVQQIGRGRDFAASMGLEVREIIDLYKRIENGLARSSKMTVHFDIPYAFFTLRKLLNDPLSRCSVLNILGMLAGGELSLCGIGATTPDLVFGHVKRDSLRRVWCDSPGLALLREQIPGRLGGICGNCIHRDICLGSCVANSFHVTGSLNAPYRFCEIAEDSGYFPPSRKKNNT